MLESYPEDVNPETIGLDEIVTGVRGTRGGIVAHAVQYIVRRYGEGEKMTSDSSLRTLGHALRARLTYVAIPRLISSLENWVAKNPNAPRVGIARNLVRELRDYGVYEQNPWVACETMRPSRAPQL